MTNTIMREESQNSAPIALKGTVNGKTFEILVDTGASGTLVSEKLVTENQFEIEEIENWTASTANSDKIQTCKQVKMKFFIEGNFNSEYHCAAKVIKDLNCDFIMGSDTLDRLSAEISYKNEIITLDGHTYEMGPKSYTKELLKRVNTAVEKKQKIENLVKTFMDKNPKLGKISNIEHKIPLKNTGPVRVKPYRVPFGLFEKTNEELRRLLALNIIQPSKSAYCSPAFPILKANGSIRLVNDYIKLNQNTIKDPFPIPSIFDLIMRIKGSKIFSSIDLNNGYYQIPVSVEDVHKTAFIINGRQFEYLRMPFGVTGAPGTSQRAMRETFVDLEFAEVFIDDILIHSKSPEDHFEHVKSVLNKCLENNISVNYNKSSFSLEKTKYKIELTENKYAAAIPKNGLSDLLEKPSTRRKLQKLLGKINWFRPFIRGLSTKSSPLYDLLKHKTINFEPQHTKIVEEIRNNILNQPKLNIPSFDLPFDLYCDASNIGCGSVLVQEEKIISFFSYKFKSSEKNYTVCGKEFFSIYLSLKHFSLFLSCTHTTVHTDSRNNTFNNTTSSRILRWKLLMQEVPHTIKHINGVHNYAADSLSRINTILIEENPSSELIMSWHKDLAHPGPYKLFNTIKPMYSKLKLSNVNNAINGCIDCKKEKNMKNKYGLVKGNLIAERPNAMISLDILGPVKSCHFKTGILSRNINILAIIDNFSRYCEVHIITKTTSEFIINCLNQWIKAYGSPKRVLSDNGPQFTSHSFAEFLNLNKITHVKSTPYNPNGNGLVENANRTIGEVLRLSRNLGFRRLKERIETRLNKTYNCTLKELPYSIWFNENPFSHDKINNDHTKILERLRSNAEKTERYRNTKRKSVKFTIGQLVYDKEHSQDKVDPKFSGPYKILEISRNSDRCLLDKPTSNTWRSVKNLKF